jgi:hypothetical protein
VSIDLNINGQASVSFQTPLWVDLKSVKYTSVLQRNLQTHFSVSPTSCPILSTATVASVDFPALSRTFSTTHFDLA